MQWMEDVLLQETSKNLEGPPVTKGEFLRWMGLWFFMATCAGFSKQQYFSATEINNKTGAPYRLNEWMSRNRFNAILGALTFTNVKPPTYRDKFWEVRQMLDAFNKHMRDFFLQVGRHVLMRACQYGFPNGRVLGG